MDIVLRLEAVELTAEMEFWMHRHAEMLLARHAGRIRRLTLTLSRGDGSGGSGSVRSLVTARLFDGRPIVVEAGGDLILQVVDRAVRCMARTIADAIDPLEDTHRHSRFQPPVRLRD